MQREISTSLVWLNCRVKKKWNRKLSWKEVSQSNYVGGKRRNFYLILDV